MRSSTLLSALAAATLTTASPLFNPAQLAFNPTQAAASLQQGLSHLAEGLLGSLPDDYVSKTKALADDSWGMIKGFAEENGKQFETLRHPALPEYELRVTEPKLCDETVKQYSGYLDIGKDKHLWFWFFESRNKPAKDPLVLWLNGGPGCSSSTGLLFELGPCSIRENGTVYNPNSWTESANVIFLDQPVNVGFSYSEGSEVNTSPVAAEDVFAFLSMFIARYQKYKDLDFHISGESYAGTYLPNIAHVINKNTLALREMGSHAPLPALHFKSVLIGNGLTDPLVQFGTGVYDYACNSSYAVWKPESPECQNIAQKAPTCAKLIQSCYTYGSRFTCVPAALYCWSQLYGDFEKLGLNPYDVRKKCDKAEDKDGPLCYREMSYVEKWMNQPEIKAELGVPTERGFKSCNMDVNKAFMMQGDVMHPSMSLLPDLLESGIRVLIYAGEDDFMCNYIGNYQWASALESIFHDDFNASPLLPYATLADGKKKVGSVQSAGSNGFTAGNFTYVSIAEAGHMVPFDQPGVALDLFSRWIHNTPLVLSKPHKGKEN